MVDKMMKEYEKPIVVLTEGSCEGVYAASGDDSDQNQRCRFGRREANPGSDACQACSYSGGVRDEELAGESLFENDFTGCPDDMPVKQ